MKKVMTPMSKTRKSNKKEYQPETIFEALMYGNKKIYDKTYNALKLLLGKNSFQKEIVKIRNKYNIPTDGLKKQEDYKKWRDEMEKQVKPYKEKVPYLEIDKKTKKIKRGIKTAYFSKWGQELYADINISIIQKFKLDDDFPDPIYHYIFDNDLNYVTPTYEIHLKRNKGELLRICLMKS